MTVQHCGDHAQSVRITAVRMLIRVGSISTLMLDMLTVVMYVFQVMVTAHDSGEHARTSDGHRTSDGQPQHCGEHGWDAHADNCGTRVDKYGEHAHVLVEHKL